MTSAIPTRVLTVMVCLTVCAAARGAKPTRPMAGVSAASVIAGQATHAARTAARETTRTPLKAKREGSWDGLFAGHAKPAKVGASGAAASSRTKMTTAYAKPATARAKASPVRAEVAGVDAATVRRVHAWEQAQREAAAQAAIHAADSTMRAGAVASDPVLWTAEVVYPRESGAAAGTVMAMGPARGGEAAGDGAATQPVEQVSGPADAASGLNESELGNGLEATAATRVSLPALYNSRGGLMAPAPLFGSREILLRQNEMADQDGVDRVRDDADLESLRREKKLVALPVNETVAIDQRLPENRRYARPWTADFVAAFARDFYAAFREPVQVNSAVRTVEFQRRLERVNGNAAPATGDTASPHLTGEAVDIAKHGLTRPEIAWMRAYLQPLIEQGKIDVEEEFQQACFHISVYQKYVPGAAPRMTVAASGSAGAGLP